MKHFHLIGIGGSGLSAIARVLLERGHVVSGSDRELSHLAQAVMEAGARVYQGHNPQNVQGADLVIRSSAIPDANPEVQAALAAGIPVVKRADFLGQLMEAQKVIAVAGTHGKTTTTAMVAWMLESLGQDPSYIIGGVSTNLGRNAKAGAGEWFAIEADEYDHMFLGLRPDIAIITNVEHDHPDCYPTEQDFLQAFEEFVGLIQPDGSLIACSDDPRARGLLDLAAAQGAQTISYGINEPGSDYRAGNLLSHAGAGFAFDLELREKEIVLPVALQVPGKHNIYNATAALAAADQLDLDIWKACQAIGTFQGTGRRFDVRAEIAGVLVVDDYAHHPTEIRSTLSAARARYPARKIWAVWQPHTFSRTRALLDEFSAAFEDADHVVVTDIFASREDPPQDGFSANQVVQALTSVKENASKQVVYWPGLAQTAELLSKAVRPGDVVMVLAAGDANQISVYLLEDLAARDLAHTDSRK